MVTNVVVVVVVVIVVVDVVVVADQTIVTSVYSLLDNTTTSFNTKKVNKFIYLLLAYFIYFHSNLYYCSLSTIFGIIYFNVFYFLYRPSQLCCC